MSKKLNLSKLYTLQGLLTEFADEFRGIGSKDERDAVHLVRDLVDNGLRKARGEDSKRDLRFKKGT